MKITHTQVLAQRGLALYDLRPSSAGHLKTPDR
jgi:hypothetical protein